MSNDTIYLARLTVETASPLGIGSGRRGLNTDRLVARDAYGLPYLPGTSLAGCLRSALMEKEVMDPRIVEQLFGFQKSEIQEHKHEGGWGSRVIISSGHLVGPDGKVVGETGASPDYKSDYLESLTDGWLPERDHVRINSRGVADAEGHGKFDEQLVPRGVRFVFDLGLIGGEETDAKEWETLLQQFSQPSFRIGGGTRKGFGKLKVEEIQKCVLNLREPDQLSAYLGLSSALDQPLPPAFTTSFAPALRPRSVTTAAPQNAAWIPYELTLTARDYFLFGRGAGGITRTQKSEPDKEKGWVHNLPKQETTIVWKNGKPELRQGDEAPYLLPATSIKGALSHRTAYHYNCKKKVFVEDQTTNITQLNTAAVVEELLAGQIGTFGTDIAGVEAAIRKLRELRDDSSEIKVADSAEFKRYSAEMEPNEMDKRQTNVGENNDAVRALFGYAVEGRELTEAEKKKPAQRGRVLIDDVFLEARKVTTKTFSHVMIDRYTGGAKAGALFSEDVAGTTETITFEIYVHKSVFEDETGKVTDDGKLIKAAFGKALLDIANGQLPLGGNVAKGHGIFSGTVKPPKTQEA
jgi:CRISPR/Cas system CMR subunit Cmr4 (Cas7 group RAMP superfamily)